MVRLSRLYSLSKTMNNLLSIEQLTGDEIRDLLALGHRLKAERGHHERLPPVSYTHLDVYKRQTVAHMLRSHVAIGSPPS